MARELWPNKLFMHTIARWYISGLMASSRIIYLVNTTVEGKEVRNSYNCYISSVLKTEAKNARKNNIFLTSQQVPRHL